MCIRDRVGVLLSQDLHHQQELLLQGVYMINAHAIGNARAVLCLLEPHHLHLLGGDTVPLQALVHHLPKRAVGVFQAIYGHAALRPIYHDQCGIYVIIHPYTISECREGHITVRHTYREHYYFARGILLPGSIAWHYHGSGQLHPIRTVGLRHIVTTAGVQPPHHAFPGACAQVVDGDAAGAGFVAILGHTCLQYK